jgi:hypothetical protein
MFLFMQPSHNFGLQGILLGVRPGEPIPRTGKKASKARRGDIGAGLIFLSMAERNET